MTGEGPVGVATVGKHGAVLRSSSPVLTAGETSGVTTGLIVRHVRERGGAAAVDALLRLARVPHRLSELEDTSRWVSYDTRIRLFEAAVTLLDDPLCPYAIGATALPTGLNHSLVLLLRALGSPAQVYRQMPRSVPKFTTTSTMEVLESGATHATLRYRLHEGYRHSRLDCLYAQGLISMVPEVFGLPPATLVHEECQSDGYDACVYHLTWSRRRRWHRRRATARLEPELVALRGQLQELQSAAADLVRTEDLTELLERITERAAAAVVAPAYLLALRNPDGGAPLVHSRGVEADRVDGLAQRLLDGDDLGDAAVVVEVASSRRVHGRLAALHRPGQRGPADERTMLRAYAGHAAAALDLLTALDRSRRGESRSETLLSLAHDLRSATDAATVATVVAEALPRIVGCDTATVFGWDGREGRLQAMASEGFSGAESALLAEAALEPQECPELSGMLTRLEPLLLRPDSATAAVRDLMSALELSEVVAMPLLAGKELVGVAAVGWRSTNPLPAVEEPLDRLRGVAEYAGTAMENTRLLATVRHQSLHDHLTQLPNRMLFTEELERAVQPARALGRVALLFCDLDRFKHINDVLGHAAGDELLRQVAVRLRAAVRPGDLVARLSGDEFAILLEVLPSEEVAERVAGEVAERVVQQLSAPFRIDGLDLRVTTSVGVAVHGGQEGGAEALLRAADGAMYTAKQRGRNGVAHAGRLEPAAAGPQPQTSLEGELRTAVREDQLRLHVQRLVRLDGPTDDPLATRTVGLEALLRWQHPTRGLLAPGAFLPVAEETGLVAELDLWAIRNACAQLAACDGTGSSALHVAVNTSARTLQDPRLHATVREALARNHLEPHRLVLEVVESRSLVDVPAVTERLAAIRRLGVRVALDDFGTGYSTLAWLQRLPVDQLKLDRSFTSAVTHDAKSLALAEGVLALARRAGLEVVAEGVETVEQAVVLRAAGFELAQGYLWGRPAPRRCDPHREAGSPVTAPAAAPARVPARVPAPVPVAAPVAG